MSGTSTAIETALPPGEYLSNPITLKQLRDSFEHNTPVTTRLVPHYANMLAMYERLCNGQDFGNEGTECQIRAIGIKIIGGGDDEMIAGDPKRHSEISLFFYQPNLGTVNLHIFAGGQIYLAPNCTVDENLDQRYQSRGTYCLNVRIPA